MAIVQVIMGLGGLACLIVGAIRFVGSTDRYLDRTGGFTESGAGMDAEESRQFGTSLWWLLAGAGLIAWATQIGQDR